jgi:uncharacterized protein YjcR
MIKERMTPEELALLTGYSRQTINKWVRKEGWITSPKPGVQGGKARLVHVNEKVVNLFTALAGRQMHLICQKTCPFTSHFTPDAGK